MKDSPSHGSRLGSPPNQWRNKRPDYVFLACTAAICLSLLGAGCATNPSSAKGKNTDPYLYQKANDALKAAIQYRHNPVVRAQAVEAFEAEGSEDSKPWIRTALMDDHAGVRFAACMAVGNLRDDPAKEAVRKCLGDADENVRIASRYAMNRLGDSSQSSEIPTYLLESKLPTVRRNAGMVLGMMNEPSAIPILAAAMGDSDGGVRHHALEAMARLGNADARQELVFLSNCGVGSDEVFALNALTTLQDPVYLDTFRHKLETAIHLETQLAAARGLGMLGSDAGFNLALSALSAKQSGPEDPKDPAAGKILRVRQLAVSALGAIGKREALKPLSKMLNENPDPRVQVAVARAIQDILRPRGNVKAEKTSREVK